MAREALVEWSDAQELHRILRDKPVVATDHYGIYMILEDLGDGRGRQLIYIGIVWSDTRDLMVRLQNHRKDWLGKVAKDQIFVKFGVVSTTAKINRQLIEDIESAIIFGAQPRENTMKLNSYTLYHDIVVENRRQGRYLAKYYDTAMQRKNGR